MAINKIYQGDNGIVWWPFLDRDGDELDLTDEAVTVTAVLLQNTRVVAGPFTLGTSAVLRTKTGDVHTLEYEFTSSVTNLLAKMVTILQVTINAPNDLLQVDSAQNKIYQEEIFQVI